VTRRLLTALAAALVSALAVVALATADPSAPEATGEAATGALSLAAAAGDTAILSAARMVPGDERTGTVTIRNTGGAPGTLLLTRDALHDPAGPSGGRLGEILRLRVEEVGGASLYTGPLAELAALPVGSLAAGTARTFRLTASWPDGGIPAGPASGDNALQGASVRVDYAWLTEEVVNPARPTPTPAPVTATPTPVTAVPPTPSTGSGPTSASPSATSPAPSSTTPPADQVVVLPQTASGVRLSIGRVGLRARGRVAIRLGCPTTCRVRLAGRLDDGRKRRARVLRNGKVLRGETVTRSLAARRSVRLSVPLTPRARALMNRQLTRYKRAGLTITAYVRANGRTTTTVRRIALRN
jgi:hypothetical protein